MARKMVTEWGMSDKIGFIYYGDEGARKNAWLELPGGHEYSQVTAEKIDAEVQRIMNEAYGETGKLLKENRDKLENIAQALLKYETLDATEVHALIRGEDRDLPLLSDLLDADHDNRSSPPPLKTQPKPPPEPDLGTGPIPQPG